MQKPIKPEYPKNNSKKIEKPTPVLDMYYFEDSGCGLSPIPTYATALDDLKCWETIKNKVSLEELVNSVENGDLSTVFIEVIDNALVIRKPNASQSLQYQTDLEQYNKQLKEAQLKYEEEITKYKKDLKDYRIKEAEYRIWKATCDLQQLKDSICNDLLDQSDLLNQNQQIRGST